MPANVTVAAHRTYYINGRFLGRPITGVERFASEIVREIDRLAASGKGQRWVVLAPRGVSRPNWLKNVDFRVVGRRRGHGWEQTDLWWASRNGVLVNLCNSAPVLHGRQLTVLHDALVYRHPENFSKAYGSFHRLLGRLLVHRSSLATVSKFSQSELSQLLHVSPERIGVVHNAVGHIQTVEPEVSVINRFDLAARPFLLFVGSPAANKNLANALRAFIAVDRPHAALVMVGAAASGFARSLFGELPANVVSTGRLSDAEVLALYQHATALIFPSLYEGFGIPPLEAMSVGCPVIASGIDPVREVCGDAVIYFDPLLPTSMTTVMRQAIDGSFDRSALLDAGRLRAARFSWQASAARLIEFVESVDRTNSVSAQQPPMPRDGHRTAGSGEAG